MAYVRKQGKNQLRMFWRVKDPKTGKSKLRSRNYKGDGGLAGARKEATFLEAQASHKPIAIEGNGTIADFLAAWEPIAIANLTHSSAKNKQWVFRKLKFWIGRTRLEQFSALTLVSFQKQAAAAGYTAGTQKRFYKAMKQAIRTAIAWKLIGAEALSVFDTVDVPKEPKKLPNLRSIPETEQLTAAIREQSPDFADMLLIGAYTGMRYGEIAALSTEQILGNKVLVDRTAVRGPNGQEVKMSPKTDAGRRLIPLSPEAIALIASRAARYHNSGLLFGDKNGKPYAQASVNWVTKPIAQTMALPHNFHASRHFYASRLIEQGISIPVVSKLLGHSSPAITLGVYSWVLTDPSESDAVLNALARSELPMQKNG